MANTVQVKRSGTANSTPSALEYGELALNYADGKVFWKNASNTISSFTFQSYVTSSSVSSFALTVLDDTSAAAMRATIGALASQDPAVSGNLTGDGFGAASSFDLRRASGTSSSPTVVSSAVSLGNFRFLAYDGSNYQIGASIQAFSDGAVSSTDIATNLRFSTVTAGTTTNAERMRITSAGNVGIGTTGPTALLDVNSSTLRLRTARTPASATAAGNAGDICWDASYLYICTATNTWRRIAHATW